MMSEATTSSVEALWLALPPARVCVPSVAPEVVSTNVTVPDRRPAPEPTVAVNVADPPR